LIKKKNYFLIKKVKFLNKFFSSRRRFLNVLRIIFGINYYIGFQILRCLGLSKDVKVGLITKKKLLEVSDFFVNYILIERGLRRQRNVLFLDRRIHGCVRGLRLLNGLPINGQRTHTNANTVRKLFKNYKFDS